MNKRGQQSIGMSFNMIFSIFLIVVFIIVAFIGIRHFLDLANTADIGFFYENLQDNVDKAWKGQSTEFEIEIELPEKINTICFANLSKQLKGPYIKEHKEIKDYEFYTSNTFLLPTGKTEGMPHKEIKHLNITKITSKENPYCINTKEKIIIKKDFYDKLVNIE